MNINRIFIMYGLIKIPTITVDHVINLQNSVTPQFFPPPTLNHLPRFKMPPPRLHSDFCKLIPTSDKQIFNLPPFYYDVHNPSGQPLGLIALKNAYNDITINVFDSTQGFNHPLEPFIQSKILDILNDKINEH